jgi:hypothetical protein
VRAGDAAAAGTPSAAYRARDAGTDACGLGLFAASGTQIALDASMPSIVAVLMGTVTAAFGGVLRDVVCNEIPRVFNDHRPYAICALRAAGWWWRRRPWVGRSRSPGGGCGTGRAAAPALAGLRLEATAGARSEGRPPVKLRRIPRCEVRTQALEETCRESRAGLQPGCCPDRTAELHISSTALARVTCVAQTFCPEQFDAGSLRLFGRLKSVSFNSGKQPK